MNSFFYAACQSGMAGLLNFVRFVGNLLVGLLGKVLKCYAMRGFSP